jgi:hypothetical protein
VKRKNFKELKQNNFYPLNFFFELQLISIILKIEDCPKFSGNKLGAVILFRNQ